MSSRIVASGMEIEKKSRNTSVNKSQNSGDTRKEFSMFSLPVGTFFLKLYMPYLFQINKEAMYFHYLYEDRKVWCIPIKNMILQSMKFDLLRQFVTEFKVVSLNITVVNNELFDPKTVAYVIPDKTLTLKYDTLKDLKANKYKITSLPGKKIDISYARDILDGENAYTPIADIDKPFPGALYVYTETSGPKYVGKFTLQIVINCMFKYL